MMMTGLKMQTSEELLALKRKGGEQIDDGELQRLPHQKALVYRIFSSGLARESKESLVRLRMDTARGFTDTKTSHHSWSSSFRGNHRYTGRYILREVHNADN